MTEPTREHLLEEIAMLETSNARLVKHIKRANDIAKRSGEYATTVGEYRDEAWAERDRLREQIRKVREMAEAAAKPCAYVETGVCTHEENVLDPTAVLAVLGGEGAPLATGGIVSGGVWVGERDRICSFPPAQIPKLTAIHVSDSIKEQQ